jgi:transcriptional regulator with XRE-family HTH domain
VSDASNAGGSLRDLRRRRGLTQEVVADRAGISMSFLSMVERGQRRLTRIDHVNSLASVLRVTPSEIVPDVFPGSGEWALAASTAAPAFPAIRDDLAVKRHRDFAVELMGYIIRGDGYAAGAWLRRIARDPSVSPWLLLDQIAMREIQGSRLHPVPRTHLEEVIDRGGATASLKRQRAEYQASKRNRVLWLIPCRR